MSVQEGYGNNKRTVSFDTKDILDNNINKLTSKMNKLFIQDRNQNRPLKPKIYQGRRRGQGKNNYCDRGRQWDMYRSSSSDRYRRLNYRDRLQYRLNCRERLQYV